MKALYKNIFSIDKNYSDERIKVILFGIKFKIVKNKYEQLRKQNPFNYYKKHKLNISSLPAATGQLRNIQLANLALLKELDFVCKQSNINYWLDFGTLLGAVRHKGFIPWDDDIDTGMLRLDYNKLIDAFKNHSRTPDIYADFYRDNDQQSNYFIKIQHRQCKHLFIDVFPYDFYGKSMSKKDQLDTTIKIKKIRNTLKNSTAGISNNEIKEKIHYLLESKILTPKLCTKLENSENSDLVWGIDFNHLWNNWFTNYNVVFPLKTIEFEGYKFPCINDPNAYLTSVYGNYMTYPKKLRLGHNSLKTLSEQEKKVVKELIEKQGLKCETIE